MEPRFDGFPRGQRLVGEVRRSGERDPRRWCYRWLHAEPGGGSLSRRVSWRQPFRPRSRSRFPTRVQPAPLAELNPASAHPGRCRQ